MAKRRLASSFPLAIGAWRNATTADGPGSDPYPGSTQSMRRLHHKWSDRLQISRR